MTVVILGAGPAGMFAAHAVNNFTDDFMIYATTNQQSVLQGAQYLHQPIPGLTGDLPDRQVRYVKTGNADGYSRNVYGKIRDDVSWHKYADGLHGAWNLRSAYANAWGKYRHKIRNKAVGADDIAGLTNSFSLVINTVPLTAFARPGVQYEWQDVWIETIRDDDKTYEPIDGRDLIHYNGENEWEWYRYSYLFGWASWEYSKPPTKSVRQPVHLRKPVQVRGQAVPDTWLCVGRYGAWHKAGLTHDAYYQTIDRMMGAKW